MNLIILALFLVLSFFYLIKKYLNLKKKWSCMPPFVDGRLIIGNYTQLHADRIHHCITELGKSKGDLYSLSVFGQSFVVLNSSRANYEILTKKTLEFAGRPTSSLIRIASRGFMDLAFANPNEAWLQSRSIFHKFFQMMKRLHNNNYFSEIVFYQEWPQLYSIIVDTNEPINLKPLFNSLQLKIICTMLFGEEVSNDNYLMNQIKELDKHAKIVISHVYETMLNMHPISMLFGDEAISNLLRAALIQKNLMKTLLKDDSNSEDICIKSLLDIMKSLLKSNDSILNEIHVKNILVELIFAGVDTIVNGVYGVFLYLSKYPHIQDKLYQELLKLKTNSFQLKHTKELPYTQACIYETLRMISHIPLSIFRRTLMDVEYFGYKIPKDTVVIPNLWKLHHDELIYPKPYEYKPERWLDSNGKFINTEDTRLKYFMPFGSGKRVCPGHHIANNIIFLLVTNLIYNFEMKLFNKEVNVDPRSFKLKSNLEPNSYEVLIGKRTNDKKTRRRSSEIKSLSADRDLLIKNIIQEKDMMQNFLAEDVFISENGDDIFEKLI